MMNNNEVIQVLSDADARIGMDSDVTIEECLRYTEADEDD